MNGVIIVKTYKLGCFQILYIYIIRKYNLISTHITDIKKKSRKIHIFDLLLHGKQSCYGTGKIITSSVYSHLVLRAIYILNIVFVFLFISKKNMF